MRLLRERALRHWRGILVIFLLQLFGVLLTLAQPMIIERVVAELSAGPGVGRRTLVLLLTVLVASALISAAGTLVSGQVGEDLVAELRRDVSDVLLHLEIGTSESCSHGDLAARLASDTALVRMGITVAPVSILTGVLGITGCIIAMGMISLPLLGVTLVALAILAIGAVLQLPRVRRGYARSQTALGELTAEASKSLTGARIIKTSLAEDRMSEVMHGRIGNVRSASLAALRAQTILSVLADLTVHGPIVCALAAGSWLVSKGYITMPNLVAFCLYAFYIISPVQDLVSGSSAVNQGMASAQRVMEVLAMPVEDLDRVPADPCPQTPATIQSGRPARIDCLDVTFGYPDGAGTQVNGLRASWGPGGVHAIVGPSGSGKSTLLSLMLRLREPQNGTLLLEGRDIATISLRELRQRVAYVDQESLAFEATLRENVAFGTPDATDKAIVSALERAGLYEGFRDSLEYGLDTPLNARGVRISGGERQRVAVARALLRDPEVLLLDEASSQLDAASESVVASTLEELGSRCTVLIVAHRLSTVVRAQSITVMRDGRVMDRGTHRDLMTRSELYQGLARTQFIPME